MDILPGSTAFPDVLIQTLWSTRQTCSSGRNGRPEQRSCKIMYFSHSNSAMKFLLPLCFGLAILGLTMPCQAQLSIGSIPAPVKISGAQGGKVAGGNWSSAEIQGKVYTVMYVDPDEKDLNEHVERALKSENFPRDKYGSMAIVNSAATWKPDAVIRMILKSKQKDYPDSIYIMDQDKVLVKKWGLKDDSYHVLTFGRDGKLLYSKSGALNEQDIQQLKRIIRTNL